MTADDREHTRPDGASDELVAAIGKVSEALECLERARGRLYDFHQLTGHAHALLDEAARDLAAAGVTDDARFVAEELVGRDVLPGRWTFQIVEEYEDTYYQPLAQALRDLCESHLPGRRHVYEAEMKQHDLARRANRVE